jgi:NADP-dependent 3-hydroxy acid dehydrogenase YdfG
MNLELKDKIIIVTGGAKGIGEGIEKYWQEKALFLQLSEGMKEITLE